MAKDKKAVTPKQALKQVLEYAKTLSTRRVMLSGAFGYVLAKDLESCVDVPPFDNSAMDGFAIHEADLTSKDELKVTGEIKAGALPEMNVRPGVAISIMTGAPIPKGAAAVVPVENTKYTPSPPRGEGRGEGDLQPSFKIIKPVAKGANIRKAAEDIKKGSVLLEARTWLKPIHVALAASVGVHELTVFNKPKVAVITTGDEIIKPGRLLSAGQIYESNSFLLHGLLKQIGAEMVLSVKTKDVLSHTVDTLNRSLMKADVILTTGGISVGKYDLVATALEQLGAVAHFGKVAQKPGKPLSFFTYKVPSPRRGDLPAGQAGGQGEGASKLIISLPGNPVAVGISFELFVRPLLLKMSGAKNIFRKEIKAVLDQPLKKKKGRVNYIRVFLNQKNGRLYAKSTGSQGSGVLTSMMADGIAVLPKDADLLEKGQGVKVIDLQQDYR